MSRSLRIEFPGALYRVTSRGDRREDIFVDDVDRQGLLGVVAQAMGRFDAQVMAYCLMSNHYHFVVHTRQANLSALMRHVNGVYTQGFNRRHAKVGHLFQGRFKAILVDGDAYMLEVCRYVELNPVRAGRVAEPGDWPWSSYRAHTGQMDPPSWLDSDGLHGYLLGHNLSSGADRQNAAQQYADMVAAGKGERLWSEGLNRQIYLGDDHFVQQMQDRADRAAKRSQEVPKRPRGKPKTLAHWLATSDSRDAALRRAHVESGITMSAMAVELGA